MPESRRNSFAFTATVSLDRQGVEQFVPVLIHSEFPQGLLTLCKPWLPGAICLFDKAEEALCSRFIRATDNTVKRKNGPALRG